VTSYRVRPAGARTGRLPERCSRIPGAAALFAGAALATVLGRLVPVLGAPVVGVLLGVLAGRWLRHPVTAPGIALGARALLPAAVVLLGAQLSLRQVAHVGVDAVPVMLTTLAACLTVAQLLGRRLGVGRDLRTLIGVGTGICGASAIAAVTPVLRARDRDVSYALSTIFLFNVAAVLTFPLVGHLLGLSEPAFGVFAGTAVNDTSSVVAAATSYGSAAAGVAVVVKLTRSLMIIPICLGLAVVRRRQEGTAAPGRLVPWFLVGFLLLATANSLGLVPAAVHPALTDVTAFLITAALVGVGLSTDIGGLRRAGSRPLLLGLALWVTVALTSLAVQALTAAV
jgi:uncharacterized integral membrane protein (TIGR00698 family)